LQHLSVIIPTLNEAEYLPGLLDALGGQTRRPDEIIVADAGSTDGTVELARGRGAVVVRGGMPGVGRNAGALAAKGDVLMFLDADVLPASDFVGQALAEFADAGYAVATCAIEALGGSLADQVIVGATRLYLQVIQSISARAPGACIVVRSEVHRAIGGFDESLMLSEDHDYVRRASQYGEFGVLTSVRIPVSLRRLEEEGLTRLALKFLWCEMYALAGKPVHSLPFEYEFGTHRRASSSRGQLLVDIAQLRAQLGQFGNPLQRLSKEGLNQLRRLVESEPMEATQERLRLLLEHNDLDVLERYLRRRLMLMRTNPKSLQNRLRGLPRESIRLLEPYWPRSHRPEEPPRGTDDESAQQ
jgi:glycosyltransferase involved in cell wall biosynthesis